MANTPPVATIGNHTLISNRWAQVSLWLSYSDANGDPAQLFQFQDNNAGGASAYFWTPGTQQQPANTVFTVNASDLGNVWLNGGIGAGQWTLAVRAFDGWDWGHYTNIGLNVTADAAPVAASYDHSLVLNHWARVSN